MSEKKPYPKLWRRQKPAAVSAPPVEQAIPEPAPEPPKTNAPAPRTNAGRNAAGGRRRR